MKRILVAILSCAVLLGAASCGAEDDPSDVRVEDDAGGEVHEDCGCPEGW